MCDSTCAFTKRKNALLATAPWWAKYLFESDKTVKDWLRLLQSTDEPQSQVEDLWWLVGLLMNSELRSRMQRDELYKKIIEQELNYGKRETTAG